MLKRIISIALVMLGMCGVASGQCAIGVAANEAALNNQAPPFTTMTPVAGAWTIEGQGKGVLAVASGKLAPAGFHYTYATPAFGSQEEDFTLTGLSGSTEPAIELLMQAFPNSQSSFPEVGFRIYTYGTTTYAYLYEYLYNPRSTTKYTETSFGSYSFTFTPSAPTPLHLKYIYTNGGSYPVTASLSTDNVNWTTVGTVNLGGPISGSTPPGLGLAVLSNDTTSVVTATGTNWLINGTDPTASGPGMLLSDTNVSPTTVGIGYQPSTDSLTASMLFNLSLYVIQPSACTSQQLTNLDAEIASVTQYNVALYGGSYDPDTLTYLTSTNGATDVEGGNSVTVPMGSIAIPTVTLPYNDIVGGGPSYDAFLGASANFYNSSGALVFQNEFYLGGAISGNTTNAPTNGWIEWEKAATMAELSGTTSPSPSWVTNVHGPAYVTPVTPYCSSASQPPDLNPTYYYSNFNPQGAVSFITYYALLSRVGGPGNLWVPNYFYGGGGNAYQWYNYEVIFPSIYGPSTAFVCTNFDKGTNPVGYH